MSDMRYSTFGGETALTSVDLKFEATRTSSRSTVMSVLAALLFFPQAVRKQEPWTVADESVGHGGRLFCATLRRRRRRLCVERIV